MANKSSITNLEALGMLFAPMIVPVIAVLIQIRDGKDSKDAESAIKEARELTRLALKTDPLQAGKRV